MEQKIELCIGTDREGSIRIRLSLLLMNGEAVVAEKFHSASLMPGDDPALLRTILNEHLAMPQSASGIPGAPWPSIPDAEWKKVSSVIPIFHTEALVKKNLDRKKKILLEEKLREAGGH